jgi:putative Mg2+ transporter-C (MgtC) family protein
MMDHWEIIDLYKALLALAAGIILGSEREFKDKAAGLKTITVICLGSALFSIISYKVGVADHETTRIASYIVSGVGFIGAGCIFKDGANVLGLTTAASFGWLQLWVLLLALANFTWRLLLWCVISCRFFKSDHR